MSPLQGYVGFGHYIYIALTDYAIQYRPYGVTLPSIARKGYEKQGL